METPKSLRQRPARNPTPRLSERKKSLFATRSQTPEINSDSEQENYALDGVATRNASKHKNKNSNDKVIVCHPKTPKTINFLKNNNGSSPERMDDDVFDKLPDSPPSKDNNVSSPLRRSRRLSLKPKNRSPNSTNSTPSTSKAISSNANILKTPTRKTFSDELPTLFTNSMNLNKSKKLSEEEIIDESSDDNVVPTLTLGRKRNHLASGNTNISSESKFRRLDNCERRSISTKSFYSQTKTSPTFRSAPVAVIAKRSPRSRRSFPKQAALINKGVHHKIRKRPKHKILPTIIRSKTNVDDILSTIRNEKLRKLLTAKRLEKDQIDNIHRIFKSGKNPIEMAKPLTMIGGGNSIAEFTDNDGNNNNSTTASNRCYMDGRNDVSLGFSDIECSSESEAELLEEVITSATGQQENANDPDEELENRIPTPMPGRKFFKSGYSTTKKEVKITDNIRASVSNGRLSIIQNPKQKKKKIKLRNTYVNEFSSEQAKVDEILKNFDKSVIIPDPDGTEVEVAVEDRTQFGLTSPTPILANEDDDAFEEMRMTETEEDENYEFRRRLPYNTNDPDLIEQQHILLDFLITNKICTEENFTIFIADPDNHKEEAQKIVDQLVVVIGECPDDYRQRIPYNTTDPVEIAQQKNFLEFLIENNLCNEENFQIFIADYANRHDEADRIITEVVAITHNISAEDLKRELNKFNKESMSGCGEMEISDQNKQNHKTLEAMSEKMFSIFYPENCQPIVQQKSTRKSCRTWTGGHGLDQFQIDAGQKEFGARQCKQCGLVYTVHEPDEEKLHKEFHASFYILKFKSWIDEDLVHIYPEWGTDGRIIRITEKSHMKRQERLKDVLQLVDKELGFSSYILPKHFVAYFAVRQSQIVGLCLAHPLIKAYRYISYNGVDCCTEEEFDAKCGISRIWVSPLHRRFHIASKLIRAVQLYTIFGEEIPSDKLAFSAPTEDGKKFAKSITKMENFLVY